jgi:hypothetical protein
MNALKHGAYSQQFAQVGALLAADPTVREALLAIGRKHKLRRQRANEVAAFLLTRLFQRAEDVASSRHSPSPAHERGGQGVRAPRKENGLNLTLPADDRDSINTAAGQAAIRQIRTRVRQASKIKNSASIDQTPDTTAPGQSNAP